MVFITGQLHLYCLDICAFAKMKSSVVSTWKSVNSSSVNSDAFALNSARMASISACSFNSSSRISLFNLTTAAGSIKRVEPVADWSCTMPGTCDLYSALTGRQYLPEREVMTKSCKQLRTEDEFNILFNSVWIRSAASTFWRRILRRFALASSLISSSERIQRLISVFNGVSGSSAWKYPVKESVVSS